LNSSRLVHRTHTFWKETVTDRISQSVSVVGSNWFGGDFNDSPGLLEETGGRVARIDADIVDALAASELESGVKIIGVLDSDCHDKFVGIDAISGADFDVVVLLSFEIQGTTDGNPALQGIGHHENILDVLILEIEEYSIKQSG
jgi:hypothetical protein